METVIEVNGLSKQFKRRTEKNLFKGLINPKYVTTKAVSSVSFNIKRGEAVAFLGPNGAGKTTTTKMMTGLIYPTSGQVNVLGFNPFERNFEFLHRIGLVMGNKAGLNWDLTARQSFRLFKAIYQLSDDQFNNHLGKLVELLEVETHLDTQIRRLSLGERMKMELIGAIIHNPEILFLDEPTIGLDITAKQQVRAFLRQIQQDSGVTLVLTSHDMDDVERVCDRVIIINKGVKVHDGQLDTLLKKYRSARYIRLEFDTLPNRAELKQSGGTLKEMGETAAVFKVPSNKHIAFLEHALKTWPVADIHIESVPLEEIIGDLFTRTK